MGIDTYSTTPGNNTALFPEGMLPSAVNDGMRQLQADLRTWYNDAQWIQYGDGDGPFSIIYQSATSFAVASVNVSSVYHVGRRVKAVGPTTGTIYGTISAVAFATNTVVTVTWDGASQLQNEALTIYIGILSATNSSMPGLVGEIRMYAASSAPTGWLLCNGTAVSRVTYAALFALIGTAYGVGDGSTTFNVPDLRGRAPIGIGQGSGLTNRALAAQLGTETHTLSSGEMPSHTHGPGTLATDTEAAHTHSVSGTSGANSVDHTHTFSDTTSSDGAHTHTVPLRAASQTGDATVTHWGQEPKTNDLATSSAGAHTHTVSGTTGNNSVGHTHSFSATSGSAGSHSHAVTGGASASAGSGGAHNNMQPSLAVNFIIKV